MTEKSALDLAAALVRTPSPSGHEAAAAQLLASAMRAKGFDTVHVDGMGNVIGSLTRGRGPKVLLTGHLDTVDTGDESEWAHHPLGADVVGGRLWGRGSVDMKAALACMVEGASQAAEVGFAGTLMVAGSVLEEVSGEGSAHLAETLDYEVAVLGEPSKLQLKLGHKGRVEVTARFTGAIAHAASPDLGVNALAMAARYVSDLEGLVLPTSERLGSATATPTALRTWPEGSTNVVPWSAELTIDVRTLPGMDAAQVLDLLGSAAADDRVALDVARAPSATGQGPLLAAPAYLVEDEAAVRKAQAALARTLKGHGIEPRTGYWWFSTDAPHLARGGRPVLGFGPGEEELAHTTQESVRVSDLAVATDAYRELALAYLGGKA